MRKKRGSTTIELLVFIPMFVMIFGLVLFFENRRSETEAKYISNHIAEIRENSSESERDYREQTAIAEASLRGINCRQSPIYDPNSADSSIEDLGSVRVECYSLAGTVNGETLVTQNNRVRTAIAGGTETCRHDTISC